MVQTLWKRAPWITAAALIGACGGWIASRTIQPVYRSGAGMTFQIADATPSQLAVMTEIIGAALREGDLVSDLDRAFGVGLQRVWASASDRTVVMVLVQGRGDPAAVRSAARAAAERAHSVLADMGMTGRIDQQVRQRIPAPIMKAAGSLNHVPLRIGDATPAVRVGQRFVNAGLLMGVGLGILLCASIAALERSRAHTTASPNLAGPAA
jgi:hypothetical protein